MKFKSLLLGSVAAFAFAGGNATAADLSVAEPVDYVRVCDAFGAGFWYLPQTDSCFAIAGEVAAIVSIDTNEDTWDAVVEAELAFDFSKMTDYGPLTAFIKMAGETDSDFAFKEGFITLANTTVGYTDTVAKASLGYTDSDWKLIKHDAQHIAFALDMGGADLMIGIEDPDYTRWGSTDDVPAFSFGLGVSAGAADLFLGGTFASDVNNDSAFALAGTIETSVDMLDLQAGAYYDDSNSSKSGWGAGVSGQINFSDQFQLAGSVFHTDPDGGADYWEAAVTGYYNIASGLDFFVDVPFDEDGVGTVTAKLTAAMP